LAYTAIATAIKTWLDRCVAHPPTTSEWADASPEVTSDCESNTASRVLARWDWSTKFWSGSFTCSQLAAHGRKHVEELLSSRRRYAFFVCARKKLIWWMLTNALIHWTGSRASYSGGDDRRTVRVTPLCMQSPPLARSQLGLVSVAEPKHPMILTDALRGEGFVKVGMVWLRQPDLAICDLRRTLSRFRTKRLGDLAQSTRHRIACCLHRISYLHDIRSSRIALERTYRKSEPGARGLCVGSNSLLQ
jgi:hypothetical protein